MPEEKSFHIPVLLNEVIKYFDPQPNENYIDCTLGFGGYAKEILPRIKPQGKYLGIDLDPKAIRESRKILSEYQQRVSLVNDNFINLKKIAKEQGFNLVDGILFDLGLSSYQLTDKERGFSYKIGGKLDMRFGNKSGQEEARDVLNEYRKEELIDIFENYGGFRKGEANRLTRLIVEERKIRKIETADDFKKVILKIIPAKFKKEPVLSKAFQALRIYVNEELINLKSVLKDALQILNKNGKIICISYHSLEDRIVKNFFKQESRECICPNDIPKCICKHKKSLKIITKKPIMAQKEEIVTNVRSRSAKMRVVQKLI